MPRYIHEEPTWPNLIWDGDALCTSLANVRHKQGLLLGKMGSLGFELQVEASLATLTTDVIKTSAIEGETLDPDDVRSSIARRLGLEVAGLRTVSRSVEGIVEVMLDATGNFAAPLSDERLFGWHAALFPVGHSGMSRITVGAWRPRDSEPMQVVSGPIGHETVHFEAPHADRAAQETERFIAWFNAPQVMDPILKAGISHFWFVTIHPFEDGNGRIARALADMSLARADGIRERFYSMSSQIEAERNVYYQQLEAAQRGDVNITRWLAWFLDCLGRAIENAEAGLAAVLHKAARWQRINRQPVNERQRLVLNRLMHDFQGFLTSSKYAKLAKCSQDTAARDLLELLNRGILVQNPGRGRSTSFRLADPENISS
jgi:Fic family protein